MKKWMLLVFPVVTLASCAVNKPLYSWERYERTSYNYLKKSDEKSTQELLETYQRMIETQKGTRGVPPPGICADYGFLLLQANKVDQGKAMLLQEVAYYPESKIFIDRILKMFDNEK